MLRLWREIKHDQQGPRDMERDMELRDNIIIEVEWNVSIALSGYNFCSEMQCMSDSSRTPEYLPAASYCG
jgi:hypothetical protein